MLIEDLITRSPVTVHRDARLSEAAERMDEHDVGSVVVVDDARRPVGVVTDRDIALHMADGVEDPTVERIMSLGPVTVDRNADVEACVERMEGGEVRRIVVLDDEGQVLGVVSLDDVVIHLANTLDRVARLIRAELVPV